MSTPFGAAIGTPTVSMSYPQQYPTTNNVSSYETSFNTMPHHQQAPMTYQSYPVQQQPSAGPGFMPSAPLDTPSAPSTMPSYYQTVAPVPYPQQQQAAYYSPAYPVNPHHHHHHHNIHQQQQQQVYHPAGGYPQQIPQGFPGYHNQNHYNPGLTYKQQKKLLKKQKKQEKVKQRKY